MMISDCDSNWITTLQLKGPWMAQFAAANKAIEACLEKWCKRHAEILGDVAITEVLSPLRDIGSVIFATFRASVDARSCIGFMCDVTVELRDVRGELGEGTVTPVWRVTNIDKKISAGSVGNLFGLPGTEAELDEDEPRAIDAIPPGVSEEERERVPVTSDKGQEGAAERERVPVTSDKGQEGAAENAPVVDAEEDDLVGKMDVLRQAFEGLMTGISKRASTGRQRPDA